MNDKLNQWHDERCPQQLGGESDETDLDELQEYSINFNFNKVPKQKTGIVPKEFITECMMKDNSLVFHPTNRQTLPMATPLRIKEKIPPTTDKFLEFFHATMNQRGMNIYFKVKSTITIMQIRARVLPFMKSNNLWMNNKQIDDNRPMDAAIFFKDTKSMEINMLHG